MDNAPGVWAVLLSALSVGIALGSCTGSSDSTTQPGGSGGVLPEASSETNASGSGGSTAGSGGGASGGTAGSSSQGGSSGAGGASGGSAGQGGTGASSDGGSAGTSGSGGTTVPEASTGGAAGTGPADAGTVTGSVQGHLFNALEAVLVLDTGLNGDELLILSDHAGGCTTPQFTSFANSLVLFVDFTGVGSVTVPGTYSVNTGCFPEFKSLNASCTTDAPGTSALAITGQVQLTSGSLSPGGSVAGTISLGFENGETIAGDFSASVCATDYWSLPAVCAP